MKKITKISKKIKLFSETYFKKRDYFICIYGSFATNDENKDSDLDIIFALNDYTKNDFSIIKSFIIEIHKEFNLKIDEEVPYENKLLGLYDDIKSAINLEPFLKMGLKSKYIVPLIKGDVKFLKSKEVRLRLFLNILTSPHIFVCGNKSKYEMFRKKAEQAIVKLARELTGKNCPNNNDIIDTLLTGQYGESGQAHLGYKIDRKEVVAYLEELVKRNTR
jgi:predicted nucleotidyltransferase